MFKKEEKINMIKKINLIKAASLANSFDSENLIRDESNKLIKSLPNLDSINVHKDLDKDLINLINKIWLILSRNEEKIPDTDDKREIFEYFKHEFGDTRTDDDKDKKIADLTDTLKRLQAEFENYQKRTEKECCEFRKYANAKLVTKLLPVLDSFELALKNSATGEELKKGLELIHSQFFQILKDEGLRGIDALNKKFDPYNHEVLLTEERTDKDDEFVLEELQKGYALNNNVLRHSKVKIAKHNKGGKK